LHLCTLLERLHDKKVLWQRTLHRNLPARELWVLEAVVLAAAGEEPAAEEEAAAADVATTTSALPVGV
jgi:hypothetical protein